MIRNKWFPILPKNTEKTKVFGFYYAGGNVNAFLPWTKAEAEISFIPVELSGHGRRKNEKLPASIKEIAREVAEAIEDFLDEDEFVFWGHSMGAVVAFETACYLEKYYGIKPAMLIVSARQSPSSSYKGFYQCCQGKEALVEDLRRLGMMPEALLNNKEFLDFAIPVIFNDYQINENYTYTRSILDIPIIAHYGTEDEEATEEILSEWQSVTTGSFEIKAFSGAHFYIFDSGMDYFRELESTVKKYINSKLYLLQ